MREFKITDASSAGCEVELFRKASDKHIKEKWWKKKHYSIVHSDVFGAYDSGVLNAINAFMDMSYVYKGVVFKVKQSCDAASDPEYDKPGNFIGILRNAEKKYRSEGYDAMIGYPNDNSLPGFLAIGWKEISKLHKYFLPCNISSIIKEKKNISLPVIIDLPVNLYWKRIARASKLKDITIKKSHSVSVQEYMECMDKGYIFYSPSQEELDWKFDDLEGNYSAIEGGRLLGRIIVSAYYYNENFSRANIVTDSFPEEYSDIYKKTLCQILISLKKKFDIICIYRQNEKWKNDILKSIGFMKRKGGQDGTFVIKVLTDDNEKRTILENARLWNPMMVEIDTMTSVNGRVMRNSLRNN